jgi:hypothetical protein
MTPDGALSSQKYPLSLGESPNIEEGADQGCKRDQDHMHIASCQKSEYYRVTLA